MIYNINKYGKIFFTEMAGVVSVFPNCKRKLHTTHSWDFMGLLDDQTMEVLGYSTKNQVNVVVGFIDTGLTLFLFSFLVVCISSSSSFSLFFFFKKTFTLFWLNE